MLQKGNILHSRQSAEAVASRRGSAVHFSAENATLQAMLARKAASEHARAPCSSKTPSYFPTPGVAAGAAAAHAKASALRFVLVLRDPAERTYSNFLMFRAELFHDNDTMEVAVEKRLRAIRRLLPAGSAPPSLAFDNSSDAYGRLWQAVGAEMYALADPSAPLAQAEQAPGDVAAPRRDRPQERVRLADARVAPPLLRYAVLRRRLGGAAQHAGAVLAALYNWLGLGGSYARLVYTGGARASARRAG